MMAQIPFSGEGTVAGAAKTNSSFMDEKLNGRLTAEGYDKVSMGYF
jgi:hypothetical protein